MSVDLTTKYAPKTDELFKAESKISLLTNTNYDWTGAHSIKLYKISTAPLNDYARNRSTDPSDGEGLSRYGKLLDLSATTEELLLKHDRSFIFNVDDLFDVSFLTWYTETVRHRVPHRRTSVKLISTGKTLLLSGSLCFFILPAFLCRRSGCSLNAALLCGFVLLPWPARKAAKTVKKGKISGVFVAVSMPYFSAAGVPPLNDFCTINRYLRKVWHGVGRDPLRCPRRPQCRQRRFTHSDFFKRAFDGLSPLLWGCG